MPTIGDTKTIFGRTYVYVNPNQSLGPGTWLLSDDDNSGNNENNNSGSTVPIYGQAIVSINGPIIRGMLIYLNNAGEAVAAIANSDETSRIVGVATESANVGQVTEFTQNSVLDIFNSNAITDESANTFEVGKPYYLSATNAGFWTSVPSTQTGHKIIQCGIAVDSNYMAVDIEPAARDVDGGIYAAQNESITR